MGNKVFDKTQYVVVLVMAGALGLTYFLGLMSRRELAHLNRFAAPLMAKAKDAHAAHQKQWKLYEDAVLTGELDPIADANKSAAACRNALAEIAQQSDLPQVKDKARTQLTRVEAVVPQATDVYTRLGKDERGERLEAEVADLAVQRRELDKGFSALEDMISHQLQEDLRQLEDRDHDFLALQLVLVCGAVMTVFLLIRSLVTKPLEQLVAERSEQLALSEARIRQLVENMSSGVAVYDYVAEEDEFYFKEINKGVETIEHVARKDVVGRKLTEVFPSVKDMGFHAVLKRVHETGVPEHMEECLYQDDRISGWRENYVYKLPSGEIVAVYDDVTQKHEYERQMDAMNKELQRASMEAGMAQIASGVLHNVGNVLTSLRTTGKFVQRQIKQLQIDNFRRSIDMLEENKGNLTEFFVNDPRGEKLVGFLTALADRQMRIQESLLNDAATIMAHIEHIEEIVRMQQDYARGGQFLETVTPSELIDAALKLNQTSLLRHHVTITTEIQDNPQIDVQKHKVLQILTNLIRNAKAALGENGDIDKKITIASRRTKEGMIEISVADNGIGIAQADLVKIFNHGFTTKADGHGFGLHSCANAAKELGGDIAVVSEGPRKGTTFTLSLPCRSDQSS